MHFDIPVGHYIEAQVSSGILVVGTVVDCSEAGLRVSPNKTPPGAEGGEILIPWASFSTCFVRETAPTDLSNKRILLPN